MKRPEKEVLAGMVAQGHTDRQIATVFSATARTVLRWRAKYRLAAGWIPPTAAHNASSYDKGCRCVLCTEANRVRQAAGRAARRERVSRGDVPPGLVHGLSTARNWGCLCDVCRAATKAANDDYYARHHGPNSKEAS